MYCLTAMSSAWQGLAVSGASYANDLPEPTRSFASPRIKGKTSKRGTPLASPLPRNFSFNHHESNNNEGNWDIEGAFNIEEQQDQHYQYHRPSTAQGTRRSTSQQQQSPSLQIQGSRHMFANLPNGGAAPSSMQAWEDWMDTPNTDPIPTSHHPNNSSDVNSNAINSSEVPLNPREVDEEVASAIAMMAHYTQNTQNIQNNRQNYSSTSSPTPTSQAPNPHLKPAWESPPNNNPNNPNNPKSASPSQELKIPTARAPLLSKAGRRKLNLNTGGGRNGSQTARGKLVQIGLLNNLLNERERERERERDLKASRCSVVSWDTYIHIYIYI